MTNLFKTSIVDKYVYVATEEYYYTGQIIGQVSDEYYMMRKYAVDGTNRDANFLFHLSDMTPHSDNDFWIFYDTKEELDDYVNFIESPQEEAGDSGKVVKLVKKD